ncbi:hypothetical protein E4U13_002543 [Claviceps humidiphila]|uniref:Uncharacterized protein n=1 Tax=Claviceps humidiphila TaxID=1294629 RepID=A0A9P7Q259_9HYPO|nr:hypothetical protein E4U13_002543 [Claviceps humidiphila]
MAIWMPQKVTVFRITGLDGDSIWTSIFGWMRLLIWAEFKIMNADKAHPGTPLSDSTRYDYGLRFVETRKGRTKRLTDQAFCDECLDASPIHFWFKNEDDAEQMLQLIDGSIHGVTAQFRSLNKEQVEQVPWQDDGPR